MNKNTPVNTKSQELNFIKWPKIKVALNKLSKRQAQLFFHLKSMSDDLDFVFPSQTTLARTLGLGDNRWAVSDAAEALEQAGYIHIERVGLKRVKHFYYINPQFKTSKGNKALSNFRLCATFALSFLPALAVPFNPQIAQITLSQGIYNNARTFSHCLPLSSQVFLKTLQHSVPQRHCFSTTGETYGHFAGGQPSAQHLTMNDWDEIFASTEKKRTGFEAREFEYMQAFTEEQLIELARYPMPLLKVANDRVKDDLNAGKDIGDLFAYFKAICEALANKSLQREGQKTRASIRSAPVEEYKSETRPQKDSREELRNFLAKRRSAAFSIGLEKEGLDLGEKWFYNAVVDEHGAEQADKIMNEFNPS